MVALLELSYWCLVTVSILGIFLTVAWAILQRVIYGQTHLPFAQYIKRRFIFDISFVC